MNPCVLRTMSYADQMNKFKRRVAEGKELTWFQLAACSEYFEAWNKGLCHHDMSANAIFRYKPNPSVEAEVRQKDLFMGRSGVRGNSIQNAIGRANMRSHYKRAREKWANGMIQWDGVEDRFHNSTGKESELGIPYSRSMLQSGRGLEWCKEADRRAK